MTDGLESVTSATLSRALDTASLRQQAFAANIANAHVAGYVPLRVDFESQLDALWSSLEARGSVDPFLVEQLQPRLVAQVDEAGRPAEVKLDVEVAGLVQNAVKYQALLAGLSRHYALLSYAVSDGKK